MDPVMSKTPFYKEALSPFSRKSIQAQISSAPLQLLDQIQAIELGYY